MTRSEPPGAALFTTFQLRGQTFSNRVAVSPMAQYSAVDGVVQPWHLQHLGSLAASGPGLVCIESTSVEREGYGSKTCVALHTDAQEEGLRSLIAGIRSFSGTPIGIQFGHSGRKGCGADPSQGRRALRTDEGAWPVFAPSAIPWSPNWPTPVEMDRAAIDRVIAAYGQAAERAARLDIGLLELHAAHGYLLHSFLSPVSNRREDGYGGSLAHRMRLVLEVTRRVRQAWPSDRVLGIRLNAQDWLPHGLTLDDTIDIAKAFVASGGDYVSISAGALTGEAKIPVAPGYLVPFASRVRSGARVPIFVTGMIVEAKQANQIIADEHADMLSIARAFLDDPRWVWHAAQALGVAVSYPMQYALASPASWQGAELLRPAR